MLGFSTVFILLGASATLIGTFLRMHLSLISKIAALYVQDFQDPVLLDAVDDMEDLTAGFSRKIWQKITILENFGRVAARSEEAAAIQKGV